MKKIPMILLAMFTLSGCDRQEMIYSFNHVEEASVDNEVENTESVDNICLLYTSSKPGIKQRAYAGKPEV